VADFEARVASGATQQRWVDPVGPNGEPSRLRPHPGLNQPYWLGKVGRPIQILMTVGGVAMPPDSSLGGRLFAPFLAEGFGPPLLVSVPGWSSSVLWTPGNAGHHVIGISRSQGGTFLLPFDIAP
jgi:hypothetical protein